MLSNMCEYVGASERCTPCCKKSDSLEVTNENERKLPRHFPDEGEVPNNENKLCKKRVQFGLPTAIDARYRIASTR